MQELATWRDKLYPTAHVAEAAAAAARQTLGASLAIANTGLQHQNPVLTPPLASPISMSNYHI